MRNIIICCKDCKDRKVGCHSYCKKYIKERLEYEKQTEIEKAEKEKEMSASIYVKEAVSRMRRIRRR